LTGLDIVVWDPASSKIVDQSISKAPLGLPEYLLLQPPADADSTLLSEFRSADDVYQVRTVVSRWAPQYRIVTLTSQRVLDEARWNAAWPPVAIGVAALLAVLPWLVALTGNWTNRLRQIQSRVSGIAQGRLRDEGSGESIPDPGGDELSSLIYDVTKLGEHLAELQSRVLQAEREQWIAQLASGFAHQFRNGIAGISLALQVHQKNWLV
jgi:signal transduction histidine kinase